MTIQQGHDDLRAENVSRAVKGFATKIFKMKQVLLQSSSNSWTETFYQEDPAILTGGTGQAVQEVARGANFPNVTPIWTKVQGQQIKFAAESPVYMEDKLTDAIDVQARTIFRVAEAVANAVDAYIYTTLSAATSIGTAAASDTWDSATLANRDPITDLLKGIQNMDENEYDTANMFILISPKDYRNLITNSKVINNPSYKTADVVSNGRVGQIVGATIIKTTSVSADECMLIIGQRAATWKSATGLTSTVIEDKGIKFTIRSWEIGHVQVTDPKAIYVITNTQA